MSDLDIRKEKSDTELKDKITLVDLAKEVSELKKTISIILDKLKTRNF